MSVIGTPFLCIVTMNLLFLLVLAFHSDQAVGGIAQRKQRQAEDSLRPYLGRVDPAKLCELLKCHSPMGSWCQVVEENRVLVPKCVCPNICPRQGAPVCSVLGKTYRNECLLHREACRKRRRIGLAHIGSCLVPKANCTEKEYGQFPYRLMDWFLLLTRMGVSHAPYAPPLNCLSQSQRTHLAQQTFELLDKNNDEKLSRRELRKLRYKRMPLEHCAALFLQSCDSNKNSKVTLAEWIACLVDRSERWYHSFMSMNMGWSKLCPVNTNNHLQPED
ncbi:hypothetical protein DPEC_G00035060 [Dallia pectoralis]|uniref:Uncharacterized protein n=1 Tax=Dallia pectoralis TaxID=75939 RepID=A0ACC2HDZ5_DALPE|nr:hypothetical protein DPEC_G00035060 [Dallia pectoralis]